MLGPNFDAFVHTGLEAKKYAGNFHCFSQIFGHFSGQILKKMLKIGHIITIKNQKKMKISKICFLQIFCFNFIYKMAQNQVIWVKSQKVISIFRFLKVNILQIFLYKFTENPPILRVDPNFATSVLGNGERFFNSVKSPWSHFSRR